MGWAFSQFRENHGISYEHLRSWHEKARPKNWTGF